MPVKLVVLPAATENPVTLAAAPTRSAAASVMWPTGQADHYFGARCFDTNRPRYFDTNGR